VQKKKEKILIGSLVAGLVSVLCLGGMKLVGKKMDEKEEKKP